MQEHADLQGADARALWCGRARGASGAARAFRVWTDGEAPGPTSEVEWIEAPFAGDDPYERAATGPALGRAVLGALELVLPVSPSKIIGVGRNYRAHATELGNEVPGDPLLFFKPPSCLLVSGGVVTLPRGFGRIDYEGELVVVIGRRASKVAAADAWRHVAGYALGDDVSSRELQQRDKQWTRAKGFDGFGPMSALLRLTPPGYALPAELRLTTHVDGALRQDARVGDMVFDIPTLIAHVSACMTLEPGDLIFTGTPEGVAPLAPGQRVRVTSSGALTLAPVEHGVA